MRYLVVLILLAGCVSPEERARRQELRIAQLQGQCRAYGFGYNTPEMAQCIMQLDAQARQNQAAATAAALSTSQELIQSSGPRPIPQQGITCTQQGVFTNCR
jgi:hypothetical protein